MFHVGQKVVCINDDKTLYEKKPDPYFWLLVKGQIYTIRALLTDPLAGNRPTMLLEEIPDRPAPLGDWGYGRDRFRPLVKRKTSIEVFKRMLNKGTIDGLKNLRALEKEKEPT